MKKIIITLLSVALLTLVSCASDSNAKDSKGNKIQTTYDKSKALVDEGSKTFNDCTALEEVYNMKTGWNLGNTLDATAAQTLKSETSWGQPMTTKEMIDTLAASGIKTIRIPTSWSNHLIDSDLTIDPKWMARVKEIVDWAIEADMFVILNSHHDCWAMSTPMPVVKGYYPNAVNEEASVAYLTNIWSQVALAFNNGYDEHLIFETMNEPRLRGTDHEWWTDKSCLDCSEAIKVLNNLNQTALDVIRASGGNNETRFVMVPGLRAGVDSVLNDEFRLPVDPTPDRLIISVHMYEPYNFAMGVPGDVKLTDKHKYNLKYTFDQLNIKYVKRGIPVVVGEYGATNKDNLEDRVEWFKFFLNYSRKYGICSVLWDNGNPKPSTKESERYGYYNRKELNWYFPEIIDQINEVMAKEEQ